MLTAVARTPVSLSSLCSDGPGCVGARSAAVLPVKSTLPRPPCRPHGGHGLLIGHEGADDVDVERQPEPLRPQRADGAVDAAVRAVKEETGLDVAVAGLVGPDWSGIYTNPRCVMAYDDAEVRQQGSVCFRSHLLGGEVRASGEECQSSIRSTISSVPMTTIPAPETRFMIRAPRGRSSSTVRATVPSPR
jgi:8-oxo-dGTP pyrophosphatase MutT (NUDIX family)